MAVQDLLLRRRHLMEMLYQNQTKETRLVAVFDVISTSTTTQIISNFNGDTSMMSYFSDIEIDGVMQPSVVASYRFSTTGLHTVKYTSVDATQTGGRRAFHSCDRMVSVTIPDTVTTISVQAFQNCTNLSSVTLPDSVEVISANAFNGCTSLTSISIPKNVTSVDGRAFRLCSGVTTITVDAENTDLDSRNNCNAIINSATNTLIRGCGNTVIPNNVAAIGDYAFSGCTGLTSVSLSNTIKPIGIYAFESSSITNINIPSGIQTLPTGIFDACANLTSIIIPENVMRIESYAFRDCTGLTSITCLGEFAPILANQNNIFLHTTCPIYVPAGSVNDYKAEWSAYASRIQAIPT